MPISLAEIANDPDLGQCVTIIRTTGNFAAGGWQATGTEQIPAFGVIGIAEDEALAQVPEGDRVTGSLQLVIAQPIYPTLASKSGVSDQIRWLDNLYRVAHTQPWRQLGVWIAILVRMTGK